MLSSKTLWRWNEMGSGWWDGQGMGVRWIRWVGGDSKFGMSFVQLVIPNSIWKTFFLILGTCFPTFWSTNHGENDVFLHTGHPILWVYIPFIRLGCSVIIYIIVVDMEISLERTMHSWPCENTCCAIAVDTVRLSGLFVLVFYLSSYQRIVELEIVCEQIWNTILHFQVVEDNLSKRNTCLPSDC